MFRQEKKILIFISLALILLFPFIQSRLQLRTTSITAEVDNSFSFSLENGFYQEDIEVELSLSAPHLRRMEIHYTTDGSTPTSFSPRYTAPLTFPASQTVTPVTVKAIVCDRTQRVIGGPYTATYFLGKNISDWTDALVVSITSDSDGLYSPEFGILYPMADCGPTEEDWSWFKKQNCKQRGDEWIRKAHMDIFEPDGSNVISQDIGLCVDGDHGSMIHYPYSLKVLAGSEYDASHPSFRHDIFHYYNTKGTTFSHIQDFNNMVFRNGGNEYNAGVEDPDQKGTMLRWAVGSRLADEAGFLTASSRPAMIFLNGEFYSVAFLQDTYNRHSTASKVLLDKDHLEIYKDRERACTVSGEYDQLYYSYPDISSSPILLPENQKQLEETVDMDAMFSYYAFQLLLNNTDFPKKNYAIWRYTGDSADTSWSDGKFRFFINDLDCTYDFRYDDDLWTAYFDNIKEDGTLMGSLIQVDKYKIRFLNILCDLMNSGLFEEEHLNRVIEEANGSFGQIAPYYYASEDEAKRQQNVLHLKETAFARKEKVKGFIQETFHPEYPYTLTVKAPENGASIHFSTTSLYHTDGNFSGSYYGDYPLTLTASCSNGQIFSGWKINGKIITSPQVTLDASMIRHGGIRVELITENTTSDTPLIISEVFAAEGNAWIELYNAGSTPCNLSEYSLSNDIPARHLKFTLPEQILAPGEVFLVGVDNSGILQISNAQALYLNKGNLVTDALTIPIMAEYESYGRIGETNEWRYFLSPTPAAPN